MAAVVRISGATGAGPTLATAEGGVLKYGRDGLITSAVAIPKPTAAGTNYSWHKVLLLEVTTVDAATSISNRRINHASAPATGITTGYRDDANTYTQPAALTDNATVNDALPTGFAAMPLSGAAYVYDAAAVAASALGRNGEYVSVYAGVSALYAGGANAALALPSISMLYDES